MYRSLTHMRPPANQPLQTTSSQAMTARSNVCMKNRCGGGRSLLYAASLHLRRSKLLDGLSWVHPLARNLTDSSSLNSRSKVDSCGTDSFTNRQHTTTCRIRWVYPWSIWQVGLPCPGMRWPQQ